MQVLMVTLTAMTLLLVTVRAEAAKLGGEGQPGGGEFLREKHPKVAKDYYVVPTGQNHQCSIVAGEREKKPAGALGGAPYALCEGSAQNISRMQGGRAGRGDGHETSEKNETAALVRLVRAISLAALHLHSAHSFHIASAQ